MPILLTAFLFAQSATPMQHAAHAAETPEPVCVRAGDLPANFARWHTAPAPVLRLGTPTRSAWPGAPFHPANARGRSPARTHTGSGVSILCAAWSVGIAAWASISVVSNIGTIILLDGVPSL